MTFVSLVSVLNEPILNALPVEKIFKELQMIRLEKQLLNNESKIGASTIVSEDLPSEAGNNTGIALDITKKSKAELWSELKITTVARFLSVLCAQSLLIVVIHIQLNILARKEYLASAIDLASKTQGIKLYEGEEEEVRDLKEENESEKKFLSLTYFLISQGYQAVVEEVTRSVEEKFGELNVRHELTTEEFFNLINSCFQSIQLDYPNLLGLADEEFADDLVKDELFENLKTELKTYISSEESQKVLDAIISRNFKHTQLNIEQVTKGGKLANLLIQLTKNIPNYNSDVQLEVVDSLADLSASVYSNF